MRQACMPMMHAMIGLVKQCKRDEPAEQPAGDDTPGSPVDGGSRKSDMLDVFAQTLHICGQKGRRQIKP